MNITQLSKPVEEGHPKWWLYCTGCGSDCDENYIKEECESNRFNNYAYYLIKKDNGSYSYEIYVDANEIHPELCINEQLDLNKYYAYKEEQCKDLMDWMSFIASVDPV